MIRQDGEPLLIDWGLAATGDPRAICGTPSYAAPEQLNGQVADARGDIYALGVLCYEVLAGRLPYARVVDDFEEFRRLRAGLGLIPLSKSAPDLPASFQRFIDRAMAAQPAGRFANAQKCCEALDELISGSSSPSAVIAKRYGPWLASALCLFVGFILGSVLSAGPGPVPGTNGSLQSIGQDRVTADASRRASDPEPDAGDTAWPEPTLETGGP